MASRIEPAAKQSPSTRNPGSIRVLEKLGFTLAGPGEDPNVLLYERTSD